MNKNPAFYIGVVEDRQDPLKLGRVRVRVLGLHTHDKVLLPTEDLPWAYKIQPTTSGAISGIGHAPVGVMEGTWVTVQYIDPDKQMPFIIGTLGGIPEGYDNADFLDVSKSTGAGFKDPNAKYPIKEENESYPVGSIVKEPDTNRLARHENIDATIVKLKEDGEHKTVSKANDAGTWDQSPTPYNAQYPYNNIWQSESGHIKEFDDTEGAERTLDYHRTGTYKEVDHNGTQVERIIGDKYEILERDGFVHIVGNINVCVEGANNLLVKDTLDVQVNGATNINIHDVCNINIAKDFNLTVGGNWNVKVDGNTILDTGLKTSVASGGIIGIDGSETWLQSDKASTTSLTTIDDITATPVTPPTLTVNTRTK